MKNCMTYFCRRRFSTQTHSIFFLTAKQKLCNENQLPTVKEDFRFEGFGSVYEGDTILEVIRGKWKPACDDRDFI